MYIVSMVDASVHKVKKLASGTVVDYFTYLKFAYQQCFFCIVNVWCMHKFVFTKEHDENLIIRKNNIYCT